MKTKLSSYPYRFILLCCVPGLLCLFMIIVRIYYNDVFHPGEFERLLLNPLIGLVTISALLFWAFASTRVEFDEQHVYVLRFRKKTEIIRFEELVYMREVLPFSFSRDFFWYLLCYKNEEGQLKRITLRRRPRSFRYDETLEQFIELVRTKNPSFIFKE